MSGRFGRGCTMLAVLALALVAAAAPVAAQYEDPDDPYDPYGTDPESDPETDPYGEPYAEDPDDFEDQDGFMETQSPFFPGDCTQSRKNMQCNEFGTIEMPSQVDIKGQKVHVVSTVTLNTAYEDRDARWVLFSIRNVTDDGSNPISISLKRFGTSHGDIVTTEIKKVGSNEINAWVHVMDVPTDEPITMDVEVGASDRGAYRLETLVMVFDRGYSPIKDSTGAEASLFSFTLLGVNKETSAATGGAEDEGGSKLGNKVPGLGMPLTIAAAALAAIAFARRRVA